MINRLLLCAVFNLPLSIFIFSQTAFAVSWAKTYASDSTAYSTQINSIRQTSEGGYIASGAASSTSTAGHIMNNDAWLAKLDGNGNVLWQKTFGGAHMDNANFVQQTSDGGYVAAGYANGTPFGDASPNNGNMWIAKLDSDGNFQWRKSYGATNMNIGAGSVRQASDGGYLIACGALSASYITIPAPRAACILKLNGEGDIAWLKAYGGADDHDITDIRQTADGGYIAIGSISSLPFTISRRLWVFKLDPLGKTVWQKSFDKVASGSIEQGPDGGYVVAGSSLPDQLNKSKGLILKLDAAGNIKWQKAYRIGDNSYITSLSLTSDGGYIAIGDSFYETPLPGIPIPSTHFLSWASKLDASGTVQWVKTYGSDNERAVSAHESPDKGFILAGNNGTGFFRLFKLDADGDISVCPVMKQSAITVDTAGIKAADEAVGEVPLSFSLLTNSEKVSDANTIGMSQMCVDIPLPAPNGSDVVTYIPSAFPSGGFLTSEIKPFGVYQGNGNLSLHVYFQEFESPVDIYLAIYAPSYESELIFLRPDNSGQLLSSGLVKWRENTKGPFYESLYSDVYVELLPGTYYLFTGVTPPGEISNYSITVTSFSVP